MFTKRNTLSMLALGAALVAPAVPADANDDAGRSSRFNGRVALELAAEATFEARSATLRVLRKNALANQQMKLVVKGADGADELDLYMENESGTMVQVGDFVARGRGKFVWRVRTKKGDALPFGVADVAELSGRAIEIRAEGEGEVAAYSGTCPDAEPTSEGGKKPRASANMQIEAEVSISAEGHGDDDSTSSRAVRAEIEVRRKRDGSERLEIEVENAAPGLQLTAYMESEIGVLLPIGVLEREDEEDTDGDCEYELEFRSDLGVLPFDVISISELAGRQVEIRMASGAVLAVGTVPAVEPDDDDDDADDEHEDENEDENESENESDDDDDDFPLPI